MLSTRISALKSYCHGWPSCLVGTNRLKNKSALRIFAPPDHVINLGLTSGINVCFSNSVYSLSASKINVHSIFRYMTMSNKL
jgi:hypothetical protein